MKMKLLASALLLAAASQANAALVLPNTDNGSLFLTVWDNVASKSYTRDLGLKLNDFLPAVQTPVAGKTQAFAGDALFASTFAGSTASNIQWNIVAADNVQTGFPTFNPYRLITTGVSAPSSNLTGGGMNIATTAVSVFETAANNSGCDISASCVTTFPADGSFGGNPSKWANNFGGLTLFDNAGTGFGGSLGFYYLATTSTKGLGKASISQFANATGAASWKLNADGSAAYSVPAPSAVPVPAAIWLLGSGLIGMVGVARRKSAV